MLDQLKQKPIWLSWRRVEREGKITKIPYQISGSLASSTDPRTWCTFSEAKVAQNSDGVGIVFEPGERIVGIDFDHCLTPDSIPDWLQDFISLADSYAEFSPSKTGCHILFKLTEALELEANKHYFDDKNSHVEVYVSGRYFTFTEDIMPSSTSLRAISAADFIQLLKHLGYPWKKTFTLSSDTSVQPSKNELSDPELLKKIFSSKNGKKFEDLWNGDTSAYKDDKSSADFALCCQLAFWTRKDKPRIEALWLSSPLGTREKTVERADYRTRTIDGAVAVTQEVFSPRSSTYQSEDNTDFFMSGGEHPKPLLVFSNIIRVLRTDLAFVNHFRKNEFSHLTESNFLTDEWLSLTDDVISQTRSFIAETYEPFRKVSKEMVTEAILNVAFDNRVNPPRDYFSSLVWDKTPRLNSWLHHAYGVPDDELHQAIGSNWLKGLVKRVMKPGCQFDEVLALESPQGWRKSSSIRALGSPWHVETTHSIENKDFYLTLAQNVIVEFSEGDIFDRNSMKKIKAEITKTEDQVRPPYERGIVKFKRSCVFAVTTNELELKDDTGNRRWLPVTLQKPADIEWLVANREQLFAEAFFRTLVLQESTHEYPQESLEDLQASRAEFSDYDEQVLEWFIRMPPLVRDHGVSLHDALKVIHGTTYNINRADEMRMGGIFRRTLHLEKVDRRVDGAVRKRWVATAKTEKIIQETKSYVSNSILQP